MEHKQKPNDPQQQVTTHPEVTAPVERVPGEQRSKVEEQKKKPDPRTGHDKDGNEAQTPSAREAS
jgi:hypothetical protein